MNKVGDAFLALKGCRSAFTDYDAEWYQAMVLKREAELKALEIELDRKAIAKAKATGTRYVSLAEASAMWEATKDPKTCRRWIEEGRLRRQARDQTNK